MELFFADNSAHYVLMLSTLVLLMGAAFLGKHIGKRRINKDLPVDDELKIVLGAVLSLFGLLVGFTFSFAMGGYQARVQAEENEAIAIGNAFQRISVLEDKYQPRAESMLQDYLALRIAFFNTANEEERAQTRQAAIQLQTHMWQLISQLAKQNPNAVMVTALNASNDLYTAQQKTMSSWQRQVPGAAWLLLLFFAVCSNFLLGHNIRGIHGNNTLIMLLPALISLALLMISEIDSPGAGIIYVTPDNLNALGHTLDIGGLAPK